MYGYQNRDQLKKTKLYIRKNQINCYFFFYINVCCFKKIVLKLQLETGTCFFFNSFSGKLILLMGRKTPILSNGH